MKHEGMVREKLPRGRKVALLFEAEPKKLQESQCLEHLKRFIKNRNLIRLEQLLQILTGPQYNFDGFN